MSIDSFFYYGTDDLYLQYLARFVKPGGQIGATLMDPVTSVPTQYKKTPLVRDAMQP